MSKHRIMPTDEQVLNLHAQGYTSRRMAAVLNCGREYLRRRLRAMGEAPLLENTSNKANPMHPMWSSDEDARRQAIYNRQRRGAAKTLEENNAGR